MYPITTDIPVPTVKRGVFGARQKYNFADLNKVGASFHVPLADFKSPEKAEESLRSALGAWKRRSGTKHSYTVAKSELGVGVWLSKVAVE